MKIMVTSLKRSPACTATLSAHNPAAGHHQPTPLLRLLDTPGQVWASLLWGHCSFLLGPGAQSSVCALQESISPVLCKFWQVYGGVRPTSSWSLLQEAYAILKSAAHTAPTPEAVHCWPGPLQETPKHSSVSVSVGSLGPGAIMSLVKWGLILNTIHPSYHLAEGNGNRFQYSCLENPMVGAWWATVHGVTKSRTRLSDFASLHFIILLGLFLWTWGISSQPLQRLPSYWGFSDLGHGVFPHRCSSIAQPLLWKGKSI